VVGEASDGRSAIEKSLALQPAVILMDIGMPIMDGIDATREIKRTLPETRILVLTANESDDNVFAALAAGADGYCLKNIEAEQLSIAIMAVHSGASYLDRDIAGRVLRSFVSAKPKTMEGNSSLTERELEILKLVVDGLGNQEIAEQFSITNETVKTHVRHILEKLAVSDRIKAAVKAVRQGLV
jgi:two-component system NarL family response regulator